MASLFDKLFHKNKTQVTGEPDSNAEPDSILPGSDDFSASSEEIIPEINQSTVSPCTEPTLFYGVAQSTGIQRDHNEDALFTLATHLITAEENLNFGLFLVADGMGGHKNGEIASHLAVSKVSAYVLTSLYLPLLSSIEKIESSIQEIMHKAFFQAHQAIMHETSGGGTTLTAALILGDQLTIAHIGDSRAYLLSPDQELQVLTHDHSLVKRLEELGQLSPEEASFHPQRNVLYRALGQGEDFDVDIASFHLVPGSQLILCSDGLWGVVPENELIQALTSSHDAQLVCRDLIHQANSAGGPDNISVIIIHMADCT